jgi:hypothetical protein
MSKKCRCVLCGQMIIAETQDDCVAHMEECEAFQRVHPEDGGETNPNGVYPDGRGQVPATKLDGEELKVAETDLDKMSIKELRQTISYAGLSYSDCIEKSDLRARAREALKQE